MNHLRYLGIPWVAGGRDFSGVDCYGMFVLIFKTELDIDVPDFTRDITTFKEWAHKKENKENEESLSTHAFPAFSLYTVLNNLYKPNLGMVFPELKKYDIIWMKMPYEKAMGNHMGVYWGNGMFLEARESSGSVLSKLSNRMHQINGVYRYKGIENV